MGSRKSGIVCRTLENAEELLSRRRQASLWEPPAPHWVKSRRPEEDRGIRLQVFGGHEKLLRFGELRFSYKT